MIFLIADRSMVVRSGSNALAPPGGDAVADGDPADCIHTLLFSLYLAGVGALSAQDDRVVSLFYVHVCVRFHFFRMSAISSCPESDRASRCTAFQLLTRILPGLYLTPSFAGL